MERLVRPFKSLAHAQEEGLPKIEGKTPSILLSVGPYDVRTLDSPFDIQEVFRLRHLVFRRELLGEAREGLEFDQHDLNSNHLGVFFAKENQLIATYRLLDKNKYKTYADDEFNLEGIGAFGSRVLEIGRACVHPDYRRGSVIQVLWRGLVEYMRAKKTDAIVGCSSVRNISDEDAVAIYYFLLTSKYLHPTYGVEPLPGLQIPGFWDGYKLLRGREGGDLKDVLEILPPLFKSYLRLGALVCGPPAYDPKFKSYDFFTVLERRLLNPRYQKRFKW